LHYERAFAGCLLGTAVGDALGLAAEGLPPNRQRRLFPQMDRYHLLPFGRGMCSDDTEHTIMVAQALHQSVGYTFAFNDAARFRSNLAWWMRWWLLGLPAGIGMATLKGILKLWLFAPGRWQGTFSAGNAPAMRSALIGAFWQDDARFMRLHVEASTQLTHTDPKSLQAAHAVALAASLSSQHAGRVDAAVFVQRVCEELGSGAEEFRALLERVAASVRAGEDTQAFAQSLGLDHGVTGYSFHTVPVALHAWLSHPGDYRGAVLAAIRCGGDTDTVGAFTGAIAAAGTGPEGIPAEWLDRLAEWPHTVPWMRELATTLARAKTAGFTNGSLPRSSPFKLGLRNLFFLAVVLVHGFRRLLPPY
jgi:ADP-ribosylglycohydrolase